MDNNVVNQLLNAVGGQATAGGPVTSEAGIVGQLLTALGPGGDVRKAKKILSSEQLAKMLKGKLNKKMLKEAAKDPFKGMGDWSKLLSAGTPEAAASPAGAAVPEGIVASLKGGKLDKLKALMKGKAGGGLMTGIIGYILMEQLADLAGGQQAKGLGLQAIQARKESMDPGAMTAQQLIPLLAQRAGGGGEAIQNMMGAGQGMQGGMQMPQMQQAPVGMGEQMIGAM